jgi:hypothetical protein
VRCEPVIITHESLRLHVGTTTAELWVDRGGGEESERLVDSLGAIQVVKIAVV